MSAPPELAPQSPLKEPPVYGGANVRPCSASADGYERGTREASRDWTRRPASPQVVAGSHLVGGHCCQSIRKVDDLTQVSERRKWLVRRNMTVIGGRGLAGRVGL